ncbi:hypothetical protein PV325_004558 [Microctonus aethiopoides]|nr:hypothetical protein PV325_004558 [Microctonus aethiopoides]
MNAKLTEIQNPAKSVAADHEVTNRKLEKYRKLLSFEITRLVNHSALLFNEVKKLESTYEMTNVSSLSSSEIIIAGLTVQKLFKPHMILLTPTSSFFAPESGRNGNFYHLTGVKEDHANNVRKAASDYVARRQARKIMIRSITSSLAMPMSQMADVAFLPNAKAGTFFARDNVSNFISWCRNSLGIIDCLLFESDDLIMRKNERHVILCLLEVARRGAKFGMLAPMLVQMERQIDREIAAENKASYGTGNDESDDEYEEMQPAETCLIYGPQPQIVTNDLKSLDEMHNIKAEHDTNHLHSPPACKKKRL